MEWPDRSCLLLYVSARIHLNILEIKNADAPAEYVLDIRHCTLQATFQYLLLACNAHPCIDENTEQDRECTDDVT